MMLGRVPDQCLVSAFARVIQRKQASLKGQVQFGSGKRKVKLQSLNVGKTMFWGYTYQISNFVVFSKFDYRWWLIVWKICHRYSQLRYPSFLLLLDHGPMLTSPWTPFGFSEAMNEDNDLESMPDCVNLLCRENDRAPQRGHRLSKGHHHRATSLVR